MRDRLLELLEQNARISTADLATILDVTEEEVKAEIKALEDDKIICGYQALINWEKVEKENVIALIEVKVTPQRGQGFDSIAERIYQFKEVKSIYLMSGAFDFTVIVEGKTMKEVALFVSNKLAPLDSVLSTGTCFVLKKYKDYGVIFDGKKEDERMIVSA